MKSESDTFRSRVKKCGPAELARLFDENRERLKRMVVYRLDSRLRGRVDASDVVQNTFLKASAELDDYLKSPQFAPSVWLRVLNKRSLAETHRTERAKRRMPDEKVQGLSPSLFEALSTSMESPSQFVEKAELYHQLTQLFADLPATDREIIVIHHIEQQSLEETATELGISTASAAKRYIRAIRKLKALAKQELEQTTA